MKTPLIKKINIPQLIIATSHLELTGELAVTKNKLVYLNINDAYIHHLFPLFQNPQIKKPDYFGEGSAGAHITVIYPEERKVIKKRDLQQSHRFEIKGLATAEIGLKTYYVLLVESVSLLQLRRRYGLPDLLCFKGYAIGFHITLGVEQLL